MLLRRCNGGDNNGSLNSRQRKDPPSLYYLPSDGVNKPQTALVKLLCRFLVQTYHFVK